MKKFTKLLAGITAVVLALGAAGCTKTTVYPDFINDGSSSGSTENSEKYVINVVSEGGLKLDGVKVTATSSNGEVIRRGISDKGRIEMAVGLGNYTLTVDESSLPAGYYLKEGETYHTSATSREEITIKIPSKLIELDSNKYSAYTVGSIMKDFVFTDCMGAKYQLSSLLNSGKKAVILNFWYTGCNPCRSEFPAMQRAYASRTDVEILALSDPRQGDDNPGIATYKNNLSTPISFPMGLDTIGLSTAFNVASYPTTIVIDRYGLITARTTGSEPNVNTWTSMFNKYAADNYKQDISVEDPDNPDDPTLPVKPTVSAPTPAQIATALNGGDIKVNYRHEDNEYNWPWIVSEDNDGVQTSNKGIGSSYSILYADVEMKADEVLSFEYMVDSEADHDFLYVMIDGDLVNGKGWSATDGWQEADIYVADRDRTVEIAFAFQKDAADPESFNGEDVAKIRNLHISDKSVIDTPVDIMRSCVGGEFSDEGKVSRYEHYVTAVKNEKDGFWHKDSADGPIIYLTLTQLTPWSSARSGSMSSINGQQYYNSLYNLTYYGYATGKAETFKVVIGDEDITEVLQTYKGIQDYMDAPFYFLPVNDEIKHWAEIFVEDYELRHGFEAYEHEWLEFCYYYDHYGSENHQHPDGEVCHYNNDPTIGLTRTNSYTAYEKGDFPADIETSEDSVTYNAETQRNKALINLPLAQNNGSYYKFTAKKAGVYQVRSYLYTDEPELDENGKIKVDKYGNVVYKSCSTEGASPDLSVYDSKGTYKGTAGEPRDFDELKGENYEGFSYYITLSEGETVYLLLELMPNDVGYYDFEITYKGETYETMFIASTLPGVWSYYVDDAGNQRLYYLAIPVVFDNESGYYYAADTNGNPIWDEPIYIDMIYGSFIRSEYSESNFRSLEWFVENRVFEDRIFMGDGMQAQMEEYLETAKAKDPSDPYYGLVRADKTIVGILNEYIAQNVDGGAGENNGWLAFACYLQHFGN